MFPEYKFTDEDIKKRYEAFYGDDRVFADGWMIGMMDGGGQKDEGRWTTEFRG